MQFIVMVTESLKKKPTFTIARKSSGSTHTFIKIATAKNEHTANKIVDALQREWNFNFITDNTEVLF